MKINYNNTSNRGQRAIGVNISCREILTITAACLVFTIAVIAMCMILGIEPMIIIELLTGRGLSAVAN